MDQNHEQFTTDTRFPRLVQGREASSRRRVLFLTHRVPYPPDRGDRIRAHHILQFLSKRYDVSLAAVSDEPVTADQWQVMEGLADRVAVQLISARWGKIRGLLSLMTGGAVTPAYFYRKPLARTIERWNAMAPFDAVVTLCTGMIQYARHIKGNARQILDLVDVDSVKWSDYARSSRAPMSWIYAAESRRLREIEAGRQDRLDGVAVVSEAEATIYRQEVGIHAGLTVLRHAVDTEYHQPLPDAGEVVDESTRQNARKNIVFIGVLNYRPNVEGIRWFVHNVLPLLREHVPDVNLQIVGRHPSPAVLELAGEANVQVVGSVPDVRQYLAGALASIAPLQIARGVQSKVLEAMASGRVAVCSPGAAEGIHGNDGEHLLVCRSPQEWATTLEEIIHDRQRRTTIAASARQRIEAMYPWEKCYQPLEQLIEGETPAVVLPLRHAA